MISPLMTAIGGPGGKPEGLKDGRGGAHKGSNSLLSQYKALLLMVTERKAALTVLTQKDKSGEVLVREPPKSLLLQRAAALEASIENVTAAIAGGGGGIAGGSTVGGGGVHGTNPSLKETKNDFLPGANTTTSTSSPNNHNNIINNINDGGSHTPQINSRGGSFFDFLSTIPRTIPPLRASLPSHPSTPANSPSSALPRLLHSMSGSGSGTTSMRISSKIIHSPHLSNRSTPHSQTTSVALLPELRESSSSQEQGLTPEQCLGHDDGGGGGFVAPTPTPSTDMTIATAITTDGRSTTTAPPHIGQNSPDSRVCVVS